MSGLSPSMLSLVLAAVADEAVVTRIARLDIRDVGRNG